MPGLIEKLLGIDLPERPNVRTVSGWLTAHLGRLPRAGDEITVTGGTVKVERVVNHRADRIRIVVDESGLPQDPEVPV